MSDSTEILEHLRQGQAETRLQKFLEAKGYSNCLADEFGINPWTCRLSYRPLNPEGETPVHRSKCPDRFVSFLAIPLITKDAVTDFDAAQLHRWTSDFSWQSPPELDPPFSYLKYQACSAGIILPKWPMTEGSETLESFLLIQRDGTIEFGLGQDVCSGYQNEAYFQFIPIIGRFWQFLHFVSHILAKAFPENLDGILLLLNLRGTENALLSSLAEGWAEPRFESIGSYRPKCLEKHVQVRKKVTPDLLANDIENLVHWFATRVDNAWGAFEPRCYVHQNWDPAQPFARRRSR